MSDVNLNRPIAGEGPERFDLKTHVHEEKPFLSGFKMLVALVLSLVAVVFSLGGGVYLLATGNAPEFAKVFHPDPPKPGEAAKFTPEQVKTTEESVKELFARFAEEWNGGSFPTGSVSSNFYSVTDKGERISTTADLYDPQYMIQENQVRTLTQLSNDKARVEVLELSKRKTSMKQWYSNVEGSEREDELYIERVTSYEYEVEQSGVSWRIVSRKWLAQTGARIRQAGDGEDDVKLDPEQVRFDDKRLNKDVLQPRYASMASSLQSFYFPRSDSYSDYKLNMDDGNSDRTIDMIQVRMDRAKAWIQSMTVTATVESVDQKDDVTASADVKFKAEFQLKGSQNLYVAVWRDRDTWIKAKASDSWYRARSDRLQRSPLMEHYEERAAPTTPVPSGATSPPTGDSGEGD